SMARRSAPRGPEVSGMRLGRRSLAAVVLATSLVALAGGLTPASAVADPAVATVDVTNVLAGLGGQAFKITVQNRAGVPINAVMIGTPPGFTLQQGTAAGWSPTRIPNTNVV